ncbi:MAG: hypothetical protein CMN05_05475 [Roseibacillus sp.]|jgi:hypothetical protein|nr:hypothetical protein [Roseibacillus sp.]MCP4728677.1 hypothetical protein [Roseibacillus sp.]MDP6208497.1 hypothetical protein [Roseibacillus sp.]MDP7309059.1 hypothetical protein [Roseibacillus sp.]MDP7496720.1 hypothetical protein [Roseibacillus sp.]|tara:strand:+ start:8264 stop:8650 length:387 start_codon:yes stop_codon:yes gene_type:complete
MSEEASAIDLSGLANLDRFLEMLFLVLLGAMVFYGLCRCRRKGTPWVLIFSGSSLVGFVLQGGLFLGRAGRTGLRGLEEAHETPGVGPSAETWASLHAVGELLAGASFLLAGIALIYLGWLGRTGASK